MKKHIHVDYIFSKEDGSEVTEYEMDNLIDDIIETIVKKGFFTGGSHGLYSDEEMNDKVMEI